MKKPIIKYLHIALKIFILFQLVLYISPFSSPGLTTLKFFNVSLANLYKLAFFSEYIIAILVTLNIIWARKKADPRLLIVTPLFILAIQVILMVFFEKREEFPIFGSY